MLLRAGNGFLHAVTGSRNFDFQTRIRADRKACIGRLDQCLVLGSGIQRVERITAIKNEVVDAPFKVRFMGVLFGNPGFVHRGWKKTLHAGRVLPARHHMFDVHASLAGRRLLGKCSTPPPRNYT